MTKEEQKAFIVGVALGDGNLSNPNGRAVRLRITCDNKYPNLMNDIRATLNNLFPENKVSIVERKDNCSDISLYSNALESLIPWKAKKGSKYDQNASVPNWIFSSDKTCSACLKGLIVTDGSIYKDRGYIMINLSTNIEPLARDTVRLGDILGFKSSLSRTSQPSGKDKYTVRFTKDSDQFLSKLGLHNKS